MQPQSLTPCSLRELPWRHRTHNSVSPSAAFVLPATKFDASCHAKLLIIQLLAATLYNLLSIRRQLMRSPRFDIRAAKLRTIFSAANIERIWRDKVRTSMRDQFINDGIEHFDFHVARKLECEKLSRLILSGDYTPQKAQRILVEKSKGLCRQLVIPAVRDAIVLQCLCGSHRLSSATARGAALNRGLRAPAFCNTGPDRSK